MFTLRLQKYSLWYRKNVFWGVSLLPNLLLLLINNTSDVKLVILLLPKSRILRLHCNCNSSKEDNDQTSYKSDWKPSPCLLTKSAATLIILIAHTHHAYCWWWLHWPFISQLASEGPSSHQAAGGPGTTTASSTCCVIVFIWLCCLKFLCVFLFTCLLRNTLQTPILSFFCFCCSRVKAEKPHKMIPDFCSVNTTLNFVNSSILMKI